MSHNIQKRGSIYYFRRRIPTDLIPHYNGKCEIVRSLGVKDRPTAVQLARKVSVDLDDEWERLRAGPAPAPMRVADGTATFTLYESREHMELEEEAAEASVVDDMKWEAAEEEADRLMRVIGIIERRRAEAGQGALPPIVRAAIGPAKPSRAARGAALSGRTLESLIPIWQREKKPAEKTVHGAQRAVTEIGDPDVSTITRHTIIAYRDRLLDDGKAINTINTRLSFIRILLGIAKDRGLVEINHADDTALSDDKRAVDARLPYNAEQAASVMAATAGMEKAQPAMYWLPRLALWTGARLNELHQMRKDDVQVRDGRPGLMITDEGEGGQGVAMRLKNQGSRRWVPLAGPVLNFAEWVSKRPDGPLFPAKPNKYGIVSDGLSKRYGRLLRETLKIADKRVTFHSWRHTFADLCRAAGVAPEVRMALMGHTEGGVSGTYGSADGLPAKRLIDGIKAISEVSFLPP